MSLNNNLNNNNQNDNQMTFNAQIEELNKLYLKTNNEIEKLHYENSVLLKQKEQSYHQQIESFKGENNLDYIKEGFINKKEEQLKDLMALIKKNKQEHTYKINALERDFTAKTKDIENEIKEIKKAYKSKTTELSRKLDFEIKKVQEQAKRKSSPLDKELLVVNEPIHIKTINNEIKKIRIEAIEEIYNLTKEYLKESQDIEIEYQEYLIRKEDEIRIYREQVNMKIAELKEKIELLNIDEKVNNYSYDSNYHEYLINKEKDNLLSLNEFEQQYLLELVDIKKEFFQNIYQFNQKKHQYLVNYQNLLDLNVDLEIDNLLKEKEYLYQSFNNQITLLNNLIQNLIDTITQTIKDQVGNIITKLLLINDSFLQQSIVNQSQDYSWQDYDYQFNYLRFNEEITVYKENQRKHIDKYFKHLTSQIKSLNSVLKEILQSFSSFINQEITNDRELMVKFLNHHEEVMATASEILNNKEINLKAKYNQELNALNQEVAKIKQNFETKKRLILEMYNNNILEHQNQLRKFDEEIKLEKKELSQKLKKK